MPRRRAPAKPVAVATPEQALQRRLHYRFRDPALLETALTHSSAAHEQGQQVIESERLEFLGDAVLGFLVGEMIYRRGPNLAEGPMSRLRAALVQEATLAARARELGLPQAVRFGRGEERSGGRDKPSIQSDIYEAVLAAVYLDGGIEAARALVDLEFVPLLEREIGRGSEGPIRILKESDPKTKLQEWLQARRRPLPSYRLLGVSGPGHARSYQVRVELNGEKLGEGSASSKQLAETRAALAALRLLRSRSERRRGAVPESGGRRISSGKAARGERRSRESRRGRAR
ncbi:MAG: ribonuclease III [Acidobacteriota bacterium]